MPDRNRKTQFKPGTSGNPKGRPKGVSAAPKELTIPQAISVVELAAKGLGPRQIARLLKARPNAVKEALAQSRRLLEVCSPQFAQHWLRASQVAAEDGDHKPAMAALQSIEVVKPIAQTYDTGSGPGSKAVAAVKVELHGFTFAGLPQPQADEPKTIDVTASTS